MSQQTCKQCGTAFEVTADDLAFYEKISPVTAGKKFSIPPPTLCPWCRMQRRMAHRNVRHLYRTASAKSGEPMISMYAPDGGFTVYSQKEWWSDDWDPLQYGQAVDPSQPLFPQFEALRLRVPRFNVYNRDSENSEYVNYAPHNKNCYLLFGCWFDEDCFYGDTMMECKSCMDGLHLERSQLCYEQVDSSNNYNSIECQACSETVDSAFCFDCRGVQHCIGCWNLRNKQYHIFNQPASREEVEALRARFSSSAFLQTFLQDFRMRKQKNAIHKAITGSNNENSLGDFLFDCKNVYFAFIGYRNQDVRYASRAVEQKDSGDLEGVGKGELVYESMSNDFAYSSIGCSTCENLKSSFYCDLCFNAKDCFGCIALRNKQYCILNRQYTQGEYESLVPRVIAAMQSNGEWGEFFPVTLSPFCYNETVAQEHFPLTEEAAHQRGWKWRPRDPKQYLPQTYVLPDSIQDTTDAVVQETLACTTCGKNFKIIPQELAFYRQQSLPVPRICPDCRHAARMSMRNPRRLWQRTCAKCHKEMMTTYAPDRPEIVYCESCYLSEVY